MTGLTTIFFIIVSIGCASGTESFVELETKLVHDLLDGYSADVIPLANNVTPLNCSVSLEPIRLLDADFVKREITVLFRKTLVWHDSRLSWDQHTGIRQLELPAKSVWRPDIVAYNGISELVALGGLDDQVVLSATGTVTYIPTVKITVFCKDKGTQCGDKHEVHGMACDLKLGSWVHNGLELDLYPGDADFVHPQDFSQASDASVTFSKAVREKKHYPHHHEAFVSNTFPIYASHLHNKW